MTARYLVYVYSAYDDHSRGVCVGIGLTRDGAREIVRSYRQYMGRVYCDIVTVLP